MSYGIFLKQSNLFLPLSFFQILSSYLCGTNKVYLIESPGNVIDIHFYSDTSVTGTGFDITFREINGKYINLHLFTSGTFGRVKEKE